MALLGWIGRCATGLGAVVALVAMPVTAQAHGDDGNPLLALVDAATQRLQTAEPVAATKWINAGAIEDPPRVEQVLRSVSVDATRKGVEPAYVRRIFTDQVHATEALEYSRFAQWKLDPPAAPTVAPDLASSRATIDRLNIEMVDQVALQWPVLHSPDCIRMVDDAKAVVAGARMLDPLYRQALDFSTHSYCTP
jgi:chorismate mutase